MSASIVHASPHIQPANKLTQDTYGTAERVRARENVGYRKADADCRRGGIVIGSFFLAVVTASVLTVIFGLRAPHYSAAIDSVSGLDGGNSTSTTLAEPLFNVTLRHDCVPSGLVVEVSYAGVPLAAGRARRSCARHGTFQEQRVVAWGADVRVPRFALDGLAAELRRGTPVFDVALQMPPTHDGEHVVLLVLCTGLRLGDAAALRSPCAVSSFDAVMPASSDVYGGGVS